MSTLEQIKSMLGTTQTEAKTEVKAEIEPFTPPPFYAPDPFDDAAEYIAACRAHGMVVHRTVLECARESAQFDGVTYQKSISLRIS